MEATQTPLQDHLPEQAIPANLQLNTHQTVQQITFTPASFDLERKDTPIDDRHEAISETHHLAPQLSAEDFLTIFQQTSKPPSQILSLALENAKDVNNLANQIALFQKIIQSSLPKRITSWIIKQIQHFLNSHQDPQSSRLSKIRLRNKAVLMGYIMFAIFQLKCNGQNVPNEVDNVIFNMKQSQVTILSLEIGGQIQRKFYHMFAKTDDKTDEEKYIRVSQSFLEYMLNFRCSQIRQFFVNPSIYNSGNTNFQQCQGKLQNLQEKQDKLAEYFKIYRVQAQLTSSSINSEQRFESNNLPEVQKIKQFCKESDQLVNILSISHEQTSCDQSTTEKQKQPQTLKCEGISQVANEEIIQANKIQIFKQPESVVIAQNILDNISPIIEVQHLVVTEVQQIVNQNIPEFEVLGSTMDTSEVAVSQPQLQQPQLQPILNIQTVIESVQESKQCIDRNTLNEVSKQAISCPLGFSDIQLTQMKISEAEKLPQNHFELEVTAPRSPIVTLQNCQNVACSAVLSDTVKEGISEEGAAGIS